MARRTWCDEPLAVGEYQDSSKSPEGAPGLSLRITAASRTWIFRARVRGGRQIRARLGTYPAVGLDAARTQAQQLRLDARDGRDFANQIATERAEREAGAMSFATLREKYLAANVARVKSGEIRATTARAYRWLLHSEHVAPFEKRLIATIRRGDVRAIYTEAAGRGHASAGASVCGALRSAFSFAMEHGWLRENVATKLRLPGSDTDAAPMVRAREGEPLDFSELVATLDAIDKLDDARPYSPWPVIFRLCFLTGMRGSVIEGLRWEELDLSAKRPMLNLPAARAKLKEASAIPLSDATAALLRALGPKDSGMVFPGRGGNKLLAKPSLEPAMMKQFLAAEAAKRGWPVFRQARARDTVQQWMEATGQDVRACDLLVGHQTRTTTRHKHYTTFSPVEKAREIINEWARVIEAERRKAARRRK